MAMRPLRDTDPARCPKCHNFIRHLYQIVRTERDDPPRIVRVPVARVCNCGWRGPMIQR